VGTIIADLILINMQIKNFHFSLSLSQLLFWGIAIVIGIVARLIFGRRFPFGVIGTILVALIGIWFATDIILVDISQDITYYGTPLLKAVVGAIVFEILWYFVAYHSYRVWLRRRDVSRALPPLNKQ
jgi:uncharacterized membrane protein YeaQ/YmgE (transglycosylase-associated protein family)